MRLRLKWQSGFPVPLQGWVSKTWCGQVLWFSMTWMITALERAWRPVVSKLRPSRQVSWQELQDDHSVKWQSPDGKRRQKKMDRSITMSDFPFSAFYIQLANTISGITLLAPLLAPGTFKTDRKQLQHTSEADNVPNAKTNYSDSPVGIQK